MKQWYYKIGAAVSTLPALLIPASAFAQLSKAKEGLEKVGGGGTKTELPVLIGQLINALLGVLGIMFVLLTVYAGYLYMMAQGNVENTEKAKKLLAQAVIGLVIIVAAYSIAQFVISTLTDAIK